MKRIFTLLLMKLRICPSCFTPRAIRLPEGPAPHYACRSCNFHWYGKYVRR